MRRVIWKQALDYVEHPGRVWDVELPTDADVVSVGITRAGAASDRWLPCVWFTFMLDNRTNLTRHRFCGVETDQPYDERLRYLGTASIPEQLDSGEPGVSPIDTEYVLHIFKAA